MANGTYIANLAYEAEDYGKDYRKVGAVLYFRTGEAKVRLDSLPPLVDGRRKRVIGLFLNNSLTEDKLGGEAPFVEGDVYHKKEKVGHIHSSQNEVGDTMYFMCLDSDVECPAWLKVKGE